MDPQQSPQDTQGYSFEEGIRGVRADKKAPVDWVSILLSIIALVLIGLGIFFLVQTLPIGKSSPSVSSSSSSSVSRTVTSIPTITTNSSISTSSSTSIASSVVSVSSSSVASIASSSAPVFNPATAPLKSGSANAEVRVTITSVGGGLVGASITETGFTGTRWFAKSGVFWNAFEAASFSPTPKVGETWRLELTITSSQENGAISQPGAIVVAKAYKL